MNKYLELKNCKYTYRKESMRNKFIINQHCHSIYEMLIILKGCVSLNIEGSERKVPAPVVVLLQPNTYHSVKSTNDGIYERVSIEIFKEYFPQDLQSFLKNFNHCIILDGKNFSYLFEKFSEVFQLDVPPTALLDSLTVQILYELFFHANFLEDFSSPTPLLQNIIQYIEDHITETFTIKEIAKALFISESSINHIFKQRMNISIKQYIIKKKIAYANILINQGYPATKAAQLVGYSNYSSFYKAKNKK